MHFSEEQWRGTSISDVALVTIIHLQEKVNNIMHDQLHRLIVSLHCTLEHILML